MNHLSQTDVCPSVVQVLATADCEGLAEALKVLFNEALRVKQTVTQEKATGFNRWIVNSNLERSQIRNRCPRIHPCPYPQRSHASDQDRQSF